MTASIPFLICLTPGCGASPLNVSPSTARALIEYGLRDDPTSQFKLPCDRCGVVSYYSLTAVLGMIPPQRRPRHLPEGFFWAVLLHELDTVAEMPERAFLGERLLLQRANGNAEHGNAALLVASVLAPSLTEGDTLSYGRWGAWSVCQSLIIDGQPREIPIAPAGRNARIGSFFSFKRGDSNLLGAHLACSNPSCGTLFELTHSEFRKAARSAEANRQAIGAADATLILTCASCGTSRIVDDRSFTGLYKL